MKNSKKFYIFLISFFLIIFNLENLLASESKKFLSLKNNEANVRIGPSKKYPIKFTYKKKYLPLEVLDEFENWREIKDFENNSGWMHVSLLSKKKTAININDYSLLYKKPTIYSKPIAKLEIGRLVLVKKCKKKWCKISTGDFNGWIFKNFLWGGFK
jgi:SH3-like domain-containing protein